MSTDPNEPKIGLILLAAGGSRRLGRPKQLLLYRGASLVRRTAKAALASRCSKIVVVLGACADACARELDGLPLMTVINPNWEEGMSRSIRVGIAALNAAEPELDATLLTLCDQALIADRHLNRLVEAFCASHPPIVASRYGGAFGAPALFHRRLFGELAQLTGDQGAKKIILRHHGSAVFVDLPEAGIDIDSVEDYAGLADLPENG